MLKKLLRAVNMKKDADKATLLKRHIDDLKQNLISPLVNMPTTQEIWKWVEEKGTTPHAYCLICNSRPLSTVDAVNAHRALTKHSWAETAF